MFEWLFDFLDRGGPVLYAILLVCLFLWTLILERLWFFYRSMPKRVISYKRDWADRSERKSWTARQIRSYMISQFKLETQTWLSFITLLIAICPLMGLLGTVTGMISVFDVLAVTGTGNARAMAAGISQATLPTMAGLLVALTGLYFKARFQRLAQQGQQKLADTLIAD
ncbi:MAG TPA: biopolymer transporter ExbB [Oceanospirillales bacterium]|nr:biopolymer transporter ExbB [Oleispira sp.]HCM04570.1 biopolymer transporter ExbB [Oceanospirillales bacterium]|tara:strand:- start:123 stop:629 length:507 start_codon:yes stop_codon:yes gene_type:complete